MPFVVRVRYNLGQFKVSIPDKPNLVLNDLYEAIKSELGIPSELQKLSFDIEGKQLITAGAHTSLKDVGISHGSMVYIPLKLIKKVVEKSTIKCDGSLIAAGTYIELDETAEQPVLVYPTVGNDKAIGGDDPIGINKAKASTIDSDVKSGSDSYLDHKASAKVEAESKYNNTQRPQTPPHESINAHDFDYVRPPDPVKKEILTLR